MARLSRAEVIDPNEINVVHVIHRTVRRCFLLGYDRESGKNFDHRKDWIENLLARFAAQFGIDLLCYSILSNHYHLILRTRPDVVATWNDTEVARRWLTICPPRKVNGQPAAPTEAELNSIRCCPTKLTEIRQRLSSVSWWMRLLGQRTAQQANREEGEAGRFWQDRYRAIRLIDEESLVACAAYVDLNPIRAAVAETLETSNHSSVQRRIVALQQVSNENASSTQPRRDAFLANLFLDETDGAAGSITSASGLRCSDKGFLPLRINSYLELLDWTARRIAAGKQGTTPAEMPPILQRLGLEASNWHELVCSFEQNFIHVAGRCDRVTVMRSHQTHRRFRLRPAARMLLPGRV